MITKEFKFDIGEKVLISASGLTGTVIALCVAKGMNVNRVQVQYVSETKSVISDWVDEDELNVLEG